MKKTRGKILWRGVENIKIREEAVKKFLVIFYEHHIDNGWHLTSRKIKKKGSEVFNKITKRKLFRKECYRSYLKSYFDHLYLLSKSSLLPQAGPKSQWFRTTHCIFLHMNYMSLAGEQPCVLSVMKPYFFYIVLLFSSTSRGHLLFIRRTGK